MISITDLRGERIVTFSCPACTDRVYPCHSCSIEKSVYNMGYNAGAKGLCFNTDTIRITLRHIYAIGYQHGQHK